MVSVNIYIINLDSSIQRLAFQQKQFEKLGLAFQRMPAISVDEISESDYQQLGFGWQRPLRKVEVACFLSHKNVWEQVVEDQVPALILEDDAVLANNLSVVLGRLELEKLTGVDLINFEVRSRKKIISKTSVLKFKDLDVELFELYQDRTGAAGYLLYPSGAKKLLKRLEVTAPAIADGFIYSAYELKALQVEPALIIQEDQLQLYGLIPKNKFDSTIGRSEHYKAVYVSSAEQKMFKKRRFMGQWKMAYRYLQVLFKSQKRLIRLKKNHFY